MALLSALDQLDELLLLDIYPAREEPIPGISALTILNKMKNPNRQLVTKDQVLDVLKHKNTDVLLTLGAGDIDTLVNPIKNLTEQIMNQTVLDTIKKIFWIGLLFAGAAVVISAVEHKRGQEVTDLIINIEALPDGHALNSTGRYLVKY